MKHTIDIPLWQPILYERRWHVWRKMPLGTERSVEGFGNRATALVVAETLNGELLQMWEKATRIR